MPLVLELVSVSVEPVLWRHGHLVEMVALIAAFAGLDEHNGPVEALSVRTDKCHAGCTCATRGAATAVPTHSAVVRSM